MTHEDIDPPESDQPIEAENVRAQLDAARSLADEERRNGQTYLDLAQRTQADFQNYKRRVEHEREKLIKDANADLLRQLLPVLDDLELALGQMPRELADQSWPRGVQLIGQKLQALLGQQGLQRIGVDGEEFDPYVHEAVAYEQHPRYAEGQVASVYRPGYRLHERVLRPAQVVVARAGSGGAPRSEASPPVDDGGQGADRTATEARGN